MSLIRDKSSVDQQACVFRPSSATTKSESLKLNLIRDKFFTKIRPIFPSFWISLQLTLYISVIMKQRWEQDLKQLW